MPPNTIESVSKELAKALTFLKPIFTDKEQAERFINFLGWELPPGVDDIGLVGLDLSSLISKLKVVLNSTSEDKKDTLLMAERYGELLVAFQQAALDIKQVVDGLPATLAAAGDYVDKTNIDELLFKRITDFIIIQQSAALSPIVFNLLVFLGIFRLEKKDADATIYQTNHLRRTIEYIRIAQLFTDSQSLFEDVYKWGKPNFDGMTLLVNLAHVLESVGVQGKVRKMPRRAEERLLGRAVPEADADPTPQLLVSLIKSLGWGNVNIGLSAYQLRPTTAGGNDAGIGIYPVARGTAELTFNLAEELFLDIEATADLKGGVALHMRPNQPISVLSDLIGGGNVGTVVSGKIGFKLRYCADDGERFTVLSIPGGSSLAVQQFYVGVGAGMATSESFDLSLETGILGNRLSITTEDADSFLAKILPKDGFKADFDLIVGWSRAQGLYFRGSATLEVKIPMHLSLGPVELNGIYVRVPAGNGDGIPIELSSSITAKLGPLTAMVDRLGVTAEFDFPKAGDGNLGPVDLKLGFKPPTGIGLSIDAESFKGGGFLFFEPDNDRYAGGLELEIADTIALKAIGLLTTKLPGGQEGFSLLIIITAEFSPIQLGLGFTLNAVGGLLGLNRTVKVERLRSGIKENTLKSVLFPTDIVANAQRIIRDLREVFPPQADRFVFGPMAKIGWGTPTLITIELGLVIEVPNPIRVALLGVLRTLLPDEKSKLLNLQVNFLGVLSIEKKQVSFDATLYNSRLLSFPLAGDMALRLMWGNNPNFLLTVGGFHPAYNPPPIALPKITRVTVSLLGGKNQNPRLTLETYFAVTSNTVQFGARLELYAASGEFNVYGFMSFEVLFQFSPFYFVAAIGATVAVRIGTESITSVYLSGKLTGPTPWKVNGTAKFEFFFCTVRVRFNKTFGKERNTKLPDVDVAPLVEAALKDKGNWQALIPSRSHLQVTLRKIDDVGEAVVAHPFGVLTVSQKVVPLKLKLDKFGNQKPKYANRFAISEVRSGSEVLATKDVKEFFAPAQFLEMGDTQRLSRKSFEKYPSGVKITASEELDSDHYAKMDVEYELTYIDTRLLLIFRDVQYVLGLQIFATLLKGNAVAKSALAFAKKAKSPLAPKGVTVEQERFAVVSTSDLKSVAGDELADSEAEAYDIMAELLAEDPGLADEIQVVPQYEVNML